MTELYLIQGGREASDAVIAGIPFEALLTHAGAEQFAARAEESAGAAVEEVIAAVAILAKSKADLVSMLAAAGPEQSADGHAALQRALAGADVLVAVLRAAEARFAIARAAAARPVSIR